MFYVTVVALFGSSSSEALQSVVTSCIQRCFSTSELATSSSLLQPPGSTFLLHFQLPASPGGNGLGKLTGDILSTHCPHTDVFLPDQHFFLNPPLLSLIHTIVYTSKYLRSEGSRYGSINHHGSYQTSPLRSDIETVPQQDLFPLEYPHVSQIYIIRRYSIK